MKKIILYSLLSTCVFLFGCSEQNNSTSSNNKTSNANLDVNSKIEEDVVLKLDTLQDKYYFTKYEDENMAVLHYYAEVQNNGNTKILLEDFLLTVEDPDGGVISSSDFGQTTTRIIYPGEKAYFAQNIDINNISDIERIDKVYNTPIFEETNYSYNPLDFEQYELQEDEVDVYSVMGKFTSKHENLSNASVSSVLFDENNELIAVLINDFQISKTNQSIPFGLTSNLYLPEEIKGKAKNSIIIGRAYEYWNIL